MFSLYFQIIVDECGMCTELETLIPLVAHKALQVVLVGDHQQLRPIVMDDTARNLGLERSMFERYADKAIMLTTQYRMVSCNTCWLICQFSYTFKCHSPTSLWP